MRGGDYRRTPPHHGPVLGIIWGFDLPPLTSLCRSSDLPFVGTGGFTRIKHPSLQAVCRDGCFTRVKHPSLQTGFWGQVGAAVETGHWKAVEAPTNTRHWKGGGSRM